MDYKDILVSAADSIGSITLNSPDTANALSRNMISEIISALKAFKNEPLLKVIIIKANGRHFCSGHDLREMIDGSVTDYKFIFDQCAKMMLLIHEVPQIVIAQIHGVATAAGCQLAAQCDLAVAADSSRFGTPGVKIGLFCSTPMVALSRSIGRKHALEMLLTGGLISATEAERFGLVNHIVPEADLEKATQDLAEAIAKSSPLTLAIGKKAFYTQIDIPEDKAYDHAVEVMTMNLMTEDAQNGIKAFLEKKTPVWKGR
ncbi:MAG: enoyl-CoA hydratase [Deltaproteobacteria bacterium]|nr:enoyl-CoA hydratase [Deltaproteobacteria bacterium]